MAHARHESDAHRVAALQHTVAFLESFWLLLGCSLLRGLKSPLALSLAAMPVMALVLQLECGINAANAAVSTLKSVANQNKRRQWISCRARQQEA